MKKTITYKLQGNGSDSWRIDYLKESGEIDSSEMVYEKPIELLPIWNQLRELLFISTAFQRALQNPQIVNNVTYGALQTIISTEGNELYLKAMLSNIMTFTIEEKAELNKILSDNNFTIQL